VLDKIAQLARRAVPGVGEVSVTLVDRGRPTTVAFTGHRKAAAIVGRVWPH